MPSIIQRQWLLYVFFIVTGMWLLLPVAHSRAESPLRITPDDGIRVIETSLSTADATISILLLHLQADDIIYAYAQNTGRTQAVPALSIRPVQQNDFSLPVPGILQEQLAPAVISYAVPVSGAYRLVLGGNAAGEFTVTVGINRIDVLAQASLNPAATRFPATTATTARATLVYDTAAGGVQEYEGEFETSRDEVQVRLDNLQAGDTIYATAEARGWVNPYLFVRDAATGRVLFEDDDGSTGFDSALYYTVFTAGDYILELITVADAGDYKLAVSLNDDDALVSDGVVSQALAVDSFACDASDLAPRPRLSGDEQTYEGEHYIIHYTQEGRDATTLSYVEALAEAIDKSLAIQLGELGWALPPPDCGEGGDTRIDIYVEDTSSKPYIGRARPERVVGDNPSTPEIEEYAAYGYMAIDNDMDSIRVESQVIPILQTTAAHEIHHVIQFGYDSNEPYRGFYEAGAAWIETLIYPDATAAYDDAGKVLSAPDACPGFDTGISDIRVYGEWVLLDSFARDNGADSYRRIWQALVAGNGLTGFYAALAEQGTSVQTAVGRMAVRNLLLDYAAADNIARPVRVEAAIDGEGFVSPRFDGVQELGVDYVALNATGRYTLELLGDPALALWAVGINTGSDYAEVIPAAAGRLTMDTRLYDEVVVFVLNTRRHTDPFRCTYSDWTIRVTATPDAPLSAATGERWNAANYRSVTAAADSTNRQLSTDN